MDSVSTFVCIVTTLLGIAISVHICSALEYQWRIRRIAARYHVTPDLVDRVYQAQDWFPFAVLDRTFTFIEKDRYLSKREKEVAYHKEAAELLTAMADGTHMPQFTMKTVMNQD